MPDPLTRSRFGLDGLDGLEDGKNVFPRPFLMVAGALSGVLSSIGVRALSAGLKMLRLFLRLLSDMALESISS